MGEEMKGFKVFSKDWTCRTKQYTCPGRFREEGRLEVDGHGMHFCKELKNCFSYYSFEPENHVAEVIAHGNVAEDSGKCCTDDIEIIREIPWQEVLDMVNTGKSCTGLCNTGDCNTGNQNAENRNAGNQNTGDWNAGYWNTGYCNTGDWNVGNSNTGDRNVGSQNTGNRNAGNRNTGNCNIGDYNAGYCNVGNYNSGHYNTGCYNTGGCNTGCWNTGDYNTGDWNKCNFSSGCFNTVTAEPKIFLFDKPSDWTFNDWKRSDARILLSQIPMDPVEWVYSSDMTDKEKAEHPSYKTTGGYLKKLGRLGRAQTWWDGLDAGKKEVILSLPNFDADIFEQCTGIRVEAK